MYKFVKEITKVRALPAALAAIVAISSAIPVYAQDVDDNLVITDGEQKVIDEDDVIVDPKDNDDKENDDIIEDSKEENKDDDFIVVDTEDLEGFKGEAGFIQTMNNSLSDFVMMDGILFQYTGIDEVVKIPDEIVTISEGAFKGNSTMKEVTIPSSVKNIGKSAFESCSALKTVDIEDGVSDLVIGESAFASCSNLRSVTLPEGVTSIGTKAFLEHGEQFTSIDIPASASELGENVMDMFINVSTFSEPKGIKEINIADGNETYYSYDGAVYSQDNSSLIYIPGARTGKYTIKDGTEKIEEGAARKSKIDSIIIPDSVTEIGVSAFNSSKITNIVIPGSVESIGEKAFYNSKIETVELEEGIMTIGKSVFETCYSLQSLTIPESVTSVGSSLVGDNGSAFKWIRFNNPETEIGNDIVDYYMTIKIYGNGGSTAEAYVIAVKENKSSAKITFVSTDDYAGAESIELDNETLDINLTEEAELNATITPSEAEVGISWYSSDSSIASVIRKKDGYNYVDTIAYVTGNKKGTATITAKTSDGKIATCVVTVHKDDEQSDFKINNDGFITGYIGEDVNVVIPSEIDGTNVVGIAESAFSGMTEIESVSIPSSVLIIEKEAFKNCALLETVTFESGIEEIGESAFEECDKLERVEMPDSVTTLGKRAFYSCGSLKEVVFSDNITVIDDETFAGCSSLISVFIPEKVAKIGNSAFGRCAKLESIGFSEGDLTSIGESAFEGCYALKNVSIPEGVTYIGKYAFLDCNGLLSFSLPSTFAEFGGNFFYQMFERYDLSKGGHLLTEITVAEGNDIYQSADGLLYKGDTMVFCPRARTTAVVKEGTTRIGDYACFICFELKRIELPSTIKSIGTNAFHNCESLEYCVLPEGLESIENSAFFACESWEGVTIPTTVTNLEAYSFAECAAKEIIVPDNITRIEEFTFWGYETTLEKVELPDTLTYIGDSAFAWAKNLKTIDIPEGVTYIGKQAFGRCDSLTFVSIPSTVNEIGEQAFVGSKALVGVYIPSTVETIASDMAYNTPNAITVFSDKNDSPAKTYADNNSLKFVELSGEDRISSEDGLTAYAENHQNLVGNDEEDVKLSVSMVDKQLSPDKTVANKIKSSVKDYKAVRYIDLSVTKAVNGGTAENLASSEKSIRVVIKLPTTLIKSDLTYKIASVQGDEVVLFDAVLNRDTLTAEINKFGALSILCEGKPEDGGNSGGGNSRGGSSKGKSTSSEKIISVEKVGNSAKVSVTTANLEKLVKNASNGSVKLDISDQKSVNNAVLPSAIFEKLAKESLGAEIILPTGNIKLDEDALKSVADSIGTKDLKVTIKEADNSVLNDEQKAAADNGIVYDISVLAGNDTISKFDGGILTITLPYELKDGETTDGIYVLYLSEDGENEKIPCTYNKNSKEVTFETKHLSLYTIAYEEVTPETPVQAGWTSPFVDVTRSDWFYNDVQYAIENNLLYGTSDTEFAPNTNMTRAMLVTLLWRMEKMPSAQKTTFTDVADGAWYADAVAWASENGIVYGITDTEFAPDSAVTREQMVQIFYRYSQSKGYDLGSAGDLSQFSDNAQISDWAEDGISWAVGNGLLYGEGSNFNPNNGATRAQVAAVIHRFAESIVK